MSDLHLPGYTPIFPISKVVKPRQRKSRLPDWGIEQQSTVGQNQTSPEWSVRWLLLPGEAEVLDAFLAERAENGEWFLWTPPGATQGRYRCDDWTKVFPNCTWREFEATFRQVYSYNLPSINVDVGAFALAGTPVGLAQSHIFMLSAGAVTLLGGDATLSKTIPLYIDTGAFGLTGADALLIQASQLSVKTGGFSYAGGSTLLLDSGESYFTGMANQIWAWDRDLQVDWWGD